MSELKCPVCHHELEYLSEDIYCSMHCPNYDCWAHDFHGSESMWEKLKNLMEENDLKYDAIVKQTKELETTRKALDVAINTLDTVYGLSEDNSNIETYIKCKRIEINGIIKGGKDEL